MKYWRCAFSCQEDKSSNKTEEIPKKEEEKKPNKPVVVREPLEMVLLLDDVAEVSDDAMSSSVKKYEKMGSNSK